MSITTWYLKMKWSIFYFKLIFDIDLIDLSMLKYPIKY